MPIPLSRECNYLTKGGGGGGRGKKVVKKIGPPVSLWSACFCFCFFALRIFLIFSLTQKYWRENQSPSTIPTVGNRGGGFSFLPEPIHLTNFGTSHNTTIANHGKSADGKKNKQKSTKLRSPVAVTYQFRAYIMMG